MNTPIINPMTIYLIDVLDNLDILICIILTILIIALSIGIVFYISWRVSEYTPDYENDVQANKQYTSILKKCIGITLLLLLITIAIPNKQTMYQMFVSSYITTENLEVAGDTIKDSVDYIFEKIDELGDE